LECLSLALVDIGKGFPFATTTPAFYEHTALPQVRLLQERLEQAENALPTFEKTYMQYKQLLEEMRETIEMVIIQVYCHTDIRTYKTNKRQKRSYKYAIHSMLQNQIH
jgi:hypothetical protein